MGLIDTLGLGGAERVAVGLANGLARQGLRSFLCTTRRGGALRELIDPRVGCLDLERRRRFSATAVWRLARFVREHEIDILHAHSSSLFIAIQCLPLCRARIVWHDHYGRFHKGKRQALPYRLAAPWIDGIVAVTEALAEWSRISLGFPADRVWYVPNAAFSDAPDAAVPEIPGTPGMRVINVANWRPQKDHLSLVEAFKRVVEEVPEATLLLAATVFDREYEARVRAKVAGLGLEERIIFLGERRDIAAILPQCDIGVIASRSEGLPLALLEYGAAGLAVVSTDVGQCQSVLDSGRAGILVPPGDPDRLADGLIRLLQDHDLRHSCGAKLQERVRASYDGDTIASSICKVYETVLQRPVITET
jgi:glycosyltransferase involved in cell wall biosynthesis